MYKIINENLGIASYRLSDLTLQQVKIFLEQWEEGAKIGELSLFYDKAENLLVLNSDNSNYDKYLDIAEAFLTAGEMEFAEIKGKAPESTKEVLQVLENCRMFRRAKGDLRINGYQGLAGLKGTYTGVLYCELSKMCENPLMLFSRAYNLGRIHGKREERARRKK